MADNGWHHAFEWTIKSKHGTLTIHEGKDGAGHRALILSRRLNTPGVGIGGRADATVWSAGTTQGDLYVHADEIEDFIKAILTYSGGVTLETST